MSNIMKTLTINGVEFDVGYSTNDLTGDMVSRYEDAVTDASEANEYSRAAYSNSSEAVTTANAAKAAVAALEGLADTTEAQQTLAQQVTLINQNAADIGILQQKHQVMSVSEYEGLELPDTDRIYMLYEDEE